MTDRYHLILFFCVMLAFSFANGVHTVNGTVKMTVVTTSGCSATVRFFRDHLIQTYALYGIFLDLEFVPWGRTVKHDDGTFTCQFGGNDCWANRLHRCVLNLLKGDQKAQMDYMACEFTPPHPAYSQGSYACAKEAGVNLVQADYCVNNADIDTLDEDARMAAIEPMAVINLVPSVFFDGSPDRSVHQQAIRRLSSVICFALADDPASGIVGCQV